MIKLISTLLTLGFCVSAFGADYKLLKSLPLGGEGGWDYALADADSRKLFISRGTHVSVMDMDSEKIIGDIADTPGVHGIAVSTKAGKGFITSGRAGRVDIFDLSTLAKTGSVAAGKNPDAITYDAVSDRIFALNGGSSDATVIGASSGKVNGTIPLGGKPEGAVPDGAGHVYVNVEDTAEIAEIDSKRMTVTRRFKIDGCDEPSGLAIDTKNHRLFAGCGNKIMAVVDSNSGKTIAKLPIGSGVDACDFDPATGFAFASTGDGHMTIVKESSPGKFSVVQTVTTQQSARTMTLDRKTHKAYLAAAKFAPAAPAAAGGPRKWPAMLPNSFVLLVVGE